MPYFPQVYARVFQIEILRSGDGDAPVALHGLDELVETVRRHLRVAVQDEHVIGAVLESVTDADVVAADVAEVVVVDEERRPGIPAAHGFHRFVGGGVVDDDHLEIGIVDFREALQARDDVVDAVPRQDDHRHARLCRRDTGFAHCVPPLARCCGTSSARWLSSSASTRQRISAPRSATP